MKPILFAAMVSLALPAYPQCIPEVKQHPDAGGNHIDECAPLTFNSNPPSSGTHYPRWAAFKTYAVPVSGGHLVHALEHGALVIGYNCPAGCASDVAALQAWVDSRPEDPGCLAQGQGVKRRIILAPNPHLDVRFAASAWLWTWKADCLDTASLEAFRAAHYAQAPEDFCFPGLAAAPEACPVGIRARPAERGGQIAVWGGTLAKRMELRLTVAAADGRVIEETEHAAGPGPAEIAWDADAFRERHPGAGPVLVRLRAGDRATASFRVDPR